MADEDLRALERAAQNGDVADVERYLGAKVRRSPDLLHKLVRRVIRLEGVIVKGRVNEEDYYSEVTTQDFLDFIEREVADRPRHAGHLTVEGEWPSEADELLGAARGGRASMFGGRAGGVPSADAVIVPANNFTMRGGDAVTISPAVIGAMQDAIATLTARVEELERRA
jgi:hypothetical protein